MDKEIDKPLEKSILQKLVDECNERVTYGTNKGKSEVWKHFAVVWLDDAATSYVKCGRCCTLLRWNSRDGTNGLRAHLAYCVTKKPQTKLINPNVFAVVKKTIPASVKSSVADQMVSMCAKDVRYVSE